MRNSTHLHSSGKNNNRGPLLRGWLLLLLFWCTTGVTKAQTNGIYESYVVVNINGAGNTYYDLNAATSNPDFQGTNLGTFSQTQSILFVGGQNKTYKCSGGDIAGGTIYYRVYAADATPGSFSGLAMAFVSNDAGGCGGNQIWQTLNGTENIKAGLPAGQYVLEVYADAPGVPGTAYANNNGANYKAQFSVSGGALFDFSGGTGAASVNTTGATVSVVSSNNNKGVVTTVDNASASGGYAGASGTFNVGNATPGGGFNATTNGFFAFTLTPPAGTQLTITGISFAARSTSTGPTNFIIRSSADGYVANLAAGPLNNNSAWTFLTPSFLPATAGGGSPLTIRIYGYNGAGASANTTVWRLDDISITNTLVRVVPPAITGFTVSPKAGSDTSGYVGSNITLSGSGFTGVNTVRVGAVAVTSFTVVNDNTITFPASNVSGRVYVQNTAGNNTSLTNYANSGYITNQPGDYATAATWLGGSLPASGSKAIIAHAVTISTAITPSLNWLNINAGASFTFSTASGALTATTLTNSGTLAWTAPGALTIAGGGTLANSGAFAAGPGTVALAGSGTISGSTAIAFNNLTLNGAAIFAGATPTINGTLLFNSSSATIDKAPAYGTASLLKYATGATPQTRGPEWSTASGAGCPAAVQLSANTTLSPAAGGKASIPLHVAKDLTIDAGSSFYMDYGGSNMTVPLVIGGNLTLAGNLSGSQNSSGTITLAGNWTNNGTTANFFPNGRSVAFNGTAPQTVGGSNGAAPPFHTIIVNNNAGVSVAAPATVTNGLTLTTGLLKLGNNQLILSAGATVNASSATSYVQTNSTGQLVQAVGTSPVFFPVGNAAYNPLRLANSGAVDNYGVSVVDGPVPGVLDAAKIVNRRWLVTEGTPGGGSLSVTASYNNGETGTGYTTSLPVYIGLYNESLWEEKMATVSGSNPFNAAGHAPFAASLPAIGTTTAYFGIGNENALVGTPAIATLSPSSKFEGDLAFALTVNGANFTNTSTVYWNGSPRPTTFVSSTQLTAAIPMADIATAGTAVITVVIAGLPASNVQSFTINPAIGPNVQTISPATAITTSSATLWGNLSAQGSPNVKEYGMLFSLTSENASPVMADSTTTATKLKVATAPVLGAYSFNRASLSVNTQYTFRAFATNDNDFLTYVYGNPVSFYTMAAMPAAPTVGGATSMTLNLAVNATGNPAHTEFAIQETGGAYLQADGSLGASPVWQTAAGWGTKTVTGLTATTTYTFRVNARNGSGVETGFGALASGTTTACAAPSGLVVANVTNSGAAISWAASASTGYEYSVSASSTPPASGTAITGTAEFVSGLNPSTNYYLHARAKCGGAFSAWSTSDPFTTLDQPTGLLTWVPSGQSAFGTNPFAPTSADARITVGSLKRGALVGAGTAVPAAANAWGGYGWQGAAAQDVAFTVTPKPGYQLSLSSLQLSYRRSATGPSAADIRYSLDNGATYLPLATVSFQTNTAGFTLPPISLAGIPTVQAGAVVLLQILPKGGDATGTWYLYNQGLVVNGNVTPIVTEPVATDASSVGTACFTANWNPVPGASFYYLYVSKLGTGRAADSTLLAGWDFSVNEKANLGIAANLNAPVTVVGTNTAVVQSNATIRADGWDNGSGAKYWEVSFSTSNYLGIRISSTQRSSNAGPKDFKLQYKIGAGGTYTDVSGGSVTVANDYTTGVLKLLSLPAACDDKALVYLRWIMASNTAAVGGGNVLPAGASNINDIKVFGYAKMSSIYHPGYEKKDVGNVASWQMTGLDPNTTYYYQVKSVVSGVTSNPSNKITVATTDFFTADYRSGQTGVWSAPATWQYQSCNGQWLPATAAPGPGNNVFVQNGHTVTLDGAVTVNAGKTLTVTSGGTLATGMFTVGGNGSFALAAGSTLSVGSSIGISASGATGAIQVAGTRTFNPAGHYTYAGSGSQATGTGLPAVITGALTIANTGGAGNNTVTLSKNTEVANLTLTSGTFAPGTGQQVSIAEGGLVAGNGAAWASSTAGGTLNFLGAGAITGATALSLYNMAINNSTVTLVKAPTINGTLFINGGNLSAGPVYAAGATLQYNTGYNRFNEWSAAGIGVAGTTPGYPYNVVVNSGTLDVYNGAPGVARALAGNLTVNSGASITFGAMNASFTVGNHLSVAGVFNMNTMTKPVYVKGNLAYTGQLTLSTAIGGDLYLAGNYTNNGTAPNFTPNNRTVFFHGAAAQTISGANTGSGFDFNYLVINNTGSGVSTTRSLTVSANLSLAAGVLTATAPATITVNNSAASAVTGGSATSFVNGPLRWRLPSSLSGSSTYTFPVGRGATFLPFSLENPQTGSTGPVIAVEAFNSGSGGTGNGTTVTLVSATEYWQASALSGSLAATGVSLARPAALGALNAIGLSTTTPNGVYASLGGAVGGNAITNSAATAGLGHFAMVSLVPAPAITGFASNNPSGTQSGYTGSVLTISGTNFTNASSVTLNGVAAGFTVESGTRITATVGAGLPATGTVSVTTPAGSASLGTFTYLGFITWANGDWNNAAIWLGGILPPAGAVATVAHAVAVNSNVVYAPAMVTVSNAGALSFGTAGNLPVTGSFINNGSVNMTAGGSFTLGGNSSFTNNGTFTPGIGSLMVNGTTATTATIYGTFTLHNVTTTGGLRFANNAAINGTLQMNGGAFINTDAPVYNTGSILQYNTGGVFHRTAEWGTTAGAGFPYHVQLSGNTTLNAGGKNGENTGRSLDLAGNLTIDAGSHFYMDYSGYHLTVPLKIGGSLLVNGTLAASNIAGGDLEVAKDWTVTGAFYPKERRVTFTGAGTQTVTREGGETFDFLTINKPAGVVVLADSITVVRELAFAKGVIATAGNKVVMAAAASLTGAAQSTGWVAGNLQKTLPAGATGRTFEIGDATDYRPLAVAFTNVTTGGGLLAAVTQSAGEHGAIDASGINRDRNVNRYYRLTPAGLAATGKYDVTLRFATADLDPGASPANFIVRRYNGAWSTTSGEVRTPLSTTASFSQLSVQNEFAVGECLAADVSAFSLSAAPVCAGSAATVTISSASLATGLYDITYERGSPNAAVNQTATVNINGGSGSFTTGLLANSGATTITVTGIRLAGTLHCSPALGSAATATVAVFSHSVAPTGITANRSTTLCATDSITLTVNDGSLGNGAGWVWYAGDCGGTPLGTGSSIKLKPAATTTYFVRAEGGCVTTTCRSVTITVGTANTWTGGSSTDWNTAANWGCGFVPPDGYDVVIPAGLSRYPRLSSNVAVGSLSLLSQATVTLNGKELMIGNGLFGNGLLIGSSTSSLVLAGGPATLYFSQDTDGLSNALGSLVINNGSVTLGSKLHLYSVLEVNGGSLDLGSRHLVLKSTASETARVAEIKGLLTGASTVTVERYIRSLSVGRRWRLLTAPVSGTSIQAAWQEGRTWNGVAAETGTGYGTLITGQQQGSAATANGSGFDFWAAVSNSSASIRRYSGGVTNVYARWLPLAGTRDLRAFDTAQAYLLFVRGDRSVSAGNAVLPTTLRATGLLRQGNQNPVLYGSSVQTHTLLGNPYAAPLDFYLFYRDNSAHLHNRYWLFNAEVGSNFGTYQLSLGNADGSYEVVPLAFDVPGHGSGNPAYRLVSSGTGFFAEPTAAANTNLLIRESHKSALTPAVNVFRTGRQVAPLQKLYLNLSEKTAAGAAHLLDGVLARWGEAAESNGNIRKAVNTGENLSLLKDGQDLIVATGTAVSAGDTLQLRLWNTTQKTYVLSMKSMNMPAGLTAFLVDRFTGTQRPLSLQNAITDVEVSVTADPAAKDPSRFYLVFRQGIALPLALTRIRASATAAGVAVEWMVAAEAGIKAYDLQRSADGQQFWSLATQEARGGAGPQTYRYTDTRPLPLGFYRVKLTGVNGEAAYSSAVKVTLQQEEGIRLYPNPVTGRRFALQFVNKPAGTYRLTFLSATGQEVAQQQFVHAGGTAVHTIRPGSRLAAGVYTLQLHQPDGTTEQVRLVAAH